MEQNKIDIMGIAVDLSALGNGACSYMINRIVNDHNLISVYAETDNDYFFKSKKEVESQIVNK